MANTAATSSSRAPPPPPPSSASLAGPAPPGAKDAARFVRFADVGRALACSLHREHAVAGMLDYSLRHVMDDEQIARVLLAAWPRWPDAVALGQALALLPAPGPASSL